MDELAHLIALPPAELAARWEQALPFLRSAAERSSGKYRVDDLVRPIRKGEMQLWGAELGPRLLGAGLTEILNFPRKRVCRALSWAGEERAKWLHCLAAIEGWAREKHACAAMEALVRPGWAPILKANGYRVSHLLLEKEL